jgi:hypothetical protein
MGSRVFKGHAPMILSHVGRHSGRSETRDVRCRIGKEQMKEFSAWRARGVTPRSRLVTMKGESQDSRVTVYIDKELTTIVDPEAAVLGAQQNPQLRDYAVNLQKQHYATVPDANMATIKSAYVVVCPDDNLSPSIAKQMQAVRESIARLENSASSLRDPQYPSWGRLFFTQLFENVPKHVSVETLLRRSAFTLLFTQDINGWTIPTTHGDLMAVDAKLFPGLTYLNHAFQRLSQESLKNKKIPSFPSLNEIIMPVALYFTGSVSARALPVIRAASVDSVNRSKVLGSHQTSFIVAHEIGHTALGHLRQAPTAHVADRSGFSSVETIVDVLLRKREDEFAADLYAYSAVKAKFMRRMQHDPKQWAGYLSMSAMLPTSIGMMFAYLHCIHAMSLRLRAVKSLGIPHPPEVDEHPEPKNRMENVLRNNPFDLFWSPETVETTWLLANRWIEGISAMDDDQFSALVVTAAKPHTPTP